MLWPESSHKPLLRATFLSGPEVFTAWDEWKRLVNVDDNPDSGSYRLLPHLFNNLRKHHIEDPFMMRLRGIVRKNWAHNNRSLASQYWPWADFSDNGIDFILLPGAATVWQYYAEYVLIPPKDTAVLVRPGALPTAVRRLTSLGWQPEGASLEMANIRTPMKSSMLWFGPDEFTLRLFWQTTLKGCGSEINEAVWNRAVQTCHQEKTYLVLCPADHILWTANLGLPEAIEPLFDRAAETMLILKAAEPVDWPDLALQAQKRWQRSPLTEVLRYLQETLDIPIPGNFLEDLRQSPDLKIEKKFLDLNQRETRAWHRSTGLWLIHSQCSPNRSLARKIITFPRFLQNAWRLSSLAQVPLYAAKAILRRLAKPAKEESNSP